MEPGCARRLWEVVRAVCHMLRRGLCRKRLMMNLQLLLGRGKLTGKALRNILAATHHHGDMAASSASASALSFYNYANDVEFSCTTTPSCPQAFFSFKNRARGRRRGEYGGLDAAEVARAFEMLNSAAGAGGETPAVAEATPSPMVPWSLGCSPAPGVRKLVVTDSPFPVMPEGDERIDDKAEKFIRWFHEQQRLQQVAGTPECRPCRRG